MCSALVSVHGLKNEFIFMCSALFSAQSTSCVARLFLLMALKNHGFSLIDRGRFKS